MLHKTIASSYRQLKTVVNRMYCSNRWQAYCKMILRHVKSVCYRSWRTFKWLNTLSSASIILLIMTNLMCRGGDTSQTDCTASFVRLTRRILFLVAFFLPCYTSIVHRKVLHSRTERRSESLKLRRRRCIMNRDVLLLENGWEKSTDFIPNSA